MLTPMPAAELSALMEVMAPYSDPSLHTLPPLYPHTTPTPPDDLGESVAGVAPSLLPPSEGGWLPAGVAGEPDPRSDTSFLLALPWMRIVIGVLMVVGNSLSLAALCQVRRLPRAMHAFISSLAVADLLMGVWCCYRYGAEMMTAGVGDAGLECRLRFVGITYLNFAAILSVCALCLDRLVALYAPFRYTDLVTGPRVRAALAAVWLFPAVVVLTAYLDTTAAAHTGQSRDCSFVGVASRRTYVVLTVLRCLLIVLIVVSELLIFRVARCQIGKIHPGVVFSGSRHSNRLLRLNAKAAVSVLAVVVPLLLLYLPVVLVQATLAVRPHTAPCHAPLLALVWLCASAHGLCTPLVFCWRFSEVRHSLLRIVRCWRPRSPTRRHSTVFHLRTDNSASTV